MEKSGASPRVLLADDHQVLLDGLRALLEPHFEVVAMVHDGRSLLEEAGRLHPDVIVCDLSMPFMNGFEAIRRLRSKYPDIKLMVLTMHSDLAFLQEAFEAGAAGYIVKQSASSELVDALQDVLSGKQYIAQPLRHLAAGISRSGAATVQQTTTKLGQRQREVLQLLAEGHSVKDAAWRLGVSVKTVEYHKYRIMSKLDLHSTAELVRFAVRHGIVSVS